MNEKTIIIADDQDIDRSFVEAVCNGLYPTYNIETYKSGEEVEERFQKGFSDVKLVILDQVMNPGKRGLELIRKYSAQASKEGCKMLLHTGEEIEGEAIGSGVAGYISKPMSLPKLEEIIKNTLKK